MNISRMTAAMYRTGQSILAQRLQPLELNGGQMDCLFVITQREGLSQMELAQMLFAGKSVFQNVSRETFAFFLFEIL
mgnify:CR=1 FL=1